MDGFEVTVSGRVATLTIDRPEKRNALTSRMWARLPELLSQIAADPEADALVITGRSGHFSAGSDVNDLPEDLDEFWRLNQTADDAVARFPKPTIAAVSGSCIGGGTEIAAGCDIRIAAESATFGITAGRLGVLYPKGPIDRLVGLIGPGAAKYLLLTGKHIDAHRAERIGLVDEVTDDIDRRVAEITDELLSSSQLAVRFIKHVTLGADPAPTDDLRAASRAELREGKDAFASRRRPAFPSNIPRKDD